MSMKITAAAVAALLLAASARAEDAKPAPTVRESIMTYFQHLKESLEKSAVQGEQKKGHTGASVAAVRGADQSSSLADPDVPILKGGASAKKEKALADENAEFAKAVDLVVAGKTEDGIKALEVFKTNYPKSHRLEDVQKAIGEAKELSAQKTADVVPAPSPAAAITAPAAVPKAAAAK